MILGVYRYGWKAFGQNEEKTVMNAGKEESTCLLAVAGSVKASVHVLVKGTQWFRVQFGPIKFQTLS